MHLRLIKPEDNKQVESMIRTCLLEYGLNIPGCAWEDPDLGNFYEVYLPYNKQYIVVEDCGEIVGGCGIGPIDGINDTCELQKMYCLKQARGKGIGQQLLEVSLKFAKQYYQYCYLETFDHMVEANRFYIKNGFELLDQPIIQTEHFACDKWYIKKL